MSISQYADQVRFQNGLADPFASLEGLDDALGLFFILLFTIGHFVHCAATLGWAPGRHVATRQ